MTTPAELIEIVEGIARIDNNASDSDRARLRDGELTTTPAELIEIV
jgi:hypothetical protein